MRAWILATVSVAIGVAVFCATRAEEVKPPPNAASSAERPVKKSAGGSSAEIKPTKKKSAEKSSTEKKSAEKKSVARHDGETDAPTETAVFAGGCFWCTEFAFEQLDGVLDVESGYTGGSKETANYEDVHHGTTGHAEVIRVTYDPEQITYEKLLDVFFDSHDPTQLNRQGEDVGKQYRSAIFYVNNEQQEQAKAKISELEKQRVFKRKIVTKLEKLKEFYPAEDYHQNFARRNPYQPYIQSHAIPKALRLRTKHPDLIRKGE